MSVKKILILTAASFAVLGATSAMAGGQTQMPYEPAFQNSVYTELHLGYAQSNWTNNNTNGIMGTSANSSFSPTTAGRGGFTVGADLGYNITQHIALEAGWFYLPQVKGGVTANGITPAGGGLAATDTAKINSWFAYTAAKLTVPVMTNLDLFGKIGVAYRALTYKMPADFNANVPGDVSGNGHIWSPLFGTGIQYVWGSWLVGAQYTYLPSNDEVNYGNTNFGAPNAAPAVNLYTGFLGYSFNV
ncbi:MAG: hypothetical protein NTU49_08610 [Gammaproteobacteria bacterium]|nr:hypothetical protein [Gammaproteobacteria bacterium]